MFREPTVKTWELLEHNGKLYSSSGQTGGHPQFPEVEGAFANSDVKQVVLVSAAKQTAEISHEPSCILVFTRGDKGVSVQQIEAAGDIGTLSAQVQRAGGDPTIVGTQNDKPLFGLTVIRNGDVPISLEKVVDAVKDPKPVSMAQDSPSQPTEQAAPAAPAQKGEKLNNSQEASERQAQKESQAQKVEGGRAGDTERSVAASESSVWTNPGTPYGGVAATSSQFDKGVAILASSAAARVGDVRRGGEQAFNVEYARSSLSPSESLKSSGQLVAAREVGVCNDETISRWMRLALAERERSAGEGALRSTEREPSSFRAGESRLGQGEAASTQAARVERSQPQLSVSSLTGAVRVVGARAEEAIQWREVRQAAAAYAIATSSREERKLESFRQVFRQGAARRDERALGGATGGRSSSAREESPQYGRAAGLRQASRDSQRSETARDRKVGVVRTTGRSDGDVGLREGAASAHSTSMVSRLMQRVFGGGDSTPLRDGQARRVGQNSARSTGEGDVTGGLNGLLSRLRRTAVTSGKGAGRGGSGKGRDAARRGSKRAARAARAKSARGGKSAGGATTKVIRRASLGGLFAAVVRDAAIDLVTLKPLRHLVRAGYERVTESVRRIPAVERGVRAVRSLRFRVTLKVARVMRRVRSSGKERSERSGGVMQQPFRARWVRSLKGTIVLAVRSGRMRREISGARDPRRGAHRERGERRAVAQAVGPSRPVQFLTWLLASLGSRPAKKRWQLRQGIDELHTLLREDESASGEGRQVVVSSEEGRPGLSEGMELEASGTPEFSAPEIAASAETSSEPVVMTQVEPTWNVKVFTGRQEDATRNAVNAGA